MNSTWPSRNWCHAPRSLLVLFVLLCLFNVSTLRAAEPEETISTQNAKLLWKKGYYMHVLGKYEKAIELFSESIDLSPTAEAYTFRGWSLSMLGHFEEAITECKEAIKLDPDYGNPYNDIGTYLIDLGQSEEAIPWLKKAMAAKRYCCYQFPHYNLGRVLLMQGKVSEARKSLERAISYDPNYLPPKALLEFIREQGLEPI